MRNGIAYRLPTLAPRISGTGCSYWLTPTVNTAEHPGQVKHKPGQQLRLTQQVNNRDLWPTPRATDGSKGGRTEEGARKELARGKNVDLGVAVKLVPTPTARDWKSGKGKTQSERGRTAGPSLPEVSGGQLNPMWVEWLMGFPLGWTDLEDSETQ